MSEERSFRTLYNLWETKDGRNIFIDGMSDLHLLHTIRAIEDGRVLSAGDYRNNWLVVLKAEAIHRGLDYTMPPSKRVSLIEWLIDKMDLSSRFFSPDNAGDFKVWLKSYFKGLTNRYGIIPPEIDVSNLTNKPSFMHYKTDPDDNSYGEPIETD